MELRAYQIKFINNIKDSIKRGNRKILAVLPTGAGKTYIMAEIARRSVGNGHKVLAMMHRRHLVNQMKDQFEDCGIDPGVIMAGIDPELSKDVQIGTVQTYHRRLDLYDVNNPFLVLATVVFIDEAHRSLSKTFQKVLSEYENKIIIGLSATPCLASGAGMGEYYEDLVEGAGIQELIDLGFLVPGRYYAPMKPDLDKLRIVAGDYHKGELGKTMNTPKLVGNVFENWARLAPGLQTIIFAVNIKHSKALCAEFQRHGISVEHLDAYSSEDRREQVLNGLKNGDIQVLCNVALFTEGFDYPGAQCIVIARPTKSMGLWRQMGGRGLRPYPDKKECVIIDHGGCIDRLGFFEDEIEWSLDGKKVAHKNKIVRKKEKHLMTCEECTYVFTGNICPQCGFKVRDYYKIIETLDAKLVEVGRRKKSFTTEEKREWFGMFEYYRRKKGYAPGWSAHKYREKFGVWPRNMNSVLPLPPTDEFNNYMKYLMIKFVKGKKKQYAN